MDYRGTVLETIGRARMLTIVGVLDDSSLAALIDATPAAIMSDWADGTLGDYGSQLMGWAAVRVLEDALQEQKHAMVAEAANYPDCTGYTEAARPS